MTYLRLPAALFVLSLLGIPAVATERSDSPAPVAPQADSAPAPDSMAQAETPPPLAPEYAERLALGDGKLSAADREDRRALVRFYQARHCTPVWVGIAGLTPAGQSVAAEIAKADDWGLSAAAFRLPPLPAPGAQLSPNEMAETEVAMSLAVLTYARHARGGRAEPMSLSRNLDRKLSLLEPQQVIEQASQASSPAAYLRALHPQHPQFERLRQAYLALKRGQPVVTSKEPVARIGGKSARRNAAAPQAPTLRKLLVNMEEWRWMPADLGDYYVWANVPEFTVRIVKDGKVVHAERIIVGKTDTQTPIFTDEMEQVIFHPFWGVPESIKRNEILPSLARGGRILERHNLRISYRGRDVDPESIEWGSVDIRNFHVYQPPGAGNVLGVVKFRFPNKHDVYMHDTPTKNLFNAPVRAFSHGCMRVRDPLKLAQLLLAEDKGWPANRVATAVTSGRQDNQINLTRKFPVHVTYFTAWVEEDGTLKLFRDLYGHENRIAMGMDGKAHLIAHAKEDKAPVQADAVGRLAETGNGRAKKEWVGEIFGRRGNY